MSLDSFLNQTCVILRPMADGQGRYNQNQYRDVQVGEITACRLVQKDLRVLDPKTSEYTWVLVTMVILPAGTDVLVHDKVTVNGVTYLVNKSLERNRTNSSHHVSVMVEALNG